MAILAAVRPQPKPVNFDPRILINSLWIVGFLLLGALVIAIVSYWRKNIRDDRTSPSEQLTHFRNLLDDGEISEEEYEALKAVLGGRIRKTLEKSTAAETTEGGPEPDNNRPGTSQVSNEPAKPGDKPSDETPA